MRKSVPCLLLLIVTFQSYAWGPTGHRVTGWIAEKYLSKKARAAVQKILDGQSLPMASTWMDEVRSDSTYDYMEDWHWVTIPSGETYQESVKNPNGDLIGTIQRVIADLKSKKFSGEDERRLLRILIHLVGDIHQPLHVGDRDDRGGNSVQVMWFRDQSNLHRVWDSDIIDNTKLSFTELAESLERPREQELRTWQRADVYEWARESQSYHERLYAYGSGRLGYDYAYIHYPVIRHRLLQAGVRLAGVLNEIYG